MEKVCTERGSARISPLRQSVKGKRNETSKNPAERHFSNVHPMETVKFTEFTAVRGNAIRTAVIYLQTVFAGRKTVNEKQSYKRIFVEQDEAWAASPHFPTIVPETESSFFLFSLFFSFFFFFGSLGRRFRLLASTRIAK